MYQQRTATLGKQAQLQHCILKEAAVTASIATTLLVAVFYVGELGEVGLPANGAERRPSTFCHGGDDHVYAASAGTVQES